MKRLIFIFIFLLSPFILFCSTDSLFTRNPVALKFNISKLVGNEYAASVDIPIGKNFISEIEIGYIRGSDDAFMAEFSRRVLNAVNFHHSGWSGMLELKKTKRFHRIITSTYGVALHYKDMSFPSQWLDFGRPFGGDGNEWDEINLSQQKKCYDITFRAGSNFLLKKKLRLDFYYGAGFRYAHAKTTYYGYYLHEEKTIDTYLDEVPSNKKIFKEDEAKIYPIFNVGMKIGFVIW